MRFLITGMTGLVGSVLRDLALDQGHEIYFLTTRKDQCTTSNSCRGFYWNPATQEIDTACFSGVDVIFHLAGASISQRWTAKNKASILNSRVHGTTLLSESLEKQRDHQVKQVVCASAIGIYPSSLTAIYSEQYQAHPNSFLQKVVLDWEAAEDRFANQGISTCKLRIGLVLTQKGGVLAPMKWVTQFGLGSAFGHGKQVQSWIHVNDLVSMMLAAASSKWQGVYNAVSPNPVSQKTFMKTLAKVMRRPFFMPSIPRWLVALVAGEMSVLVFNSQHVSAQKVENKNFKFSYPTLFTAMQSLLK